MNYIINERVIFDPYEKKLTSLSDPDLYTVLTYPSSRCLLLLLQTAPDVVAQQRFFEEVWEPMGQIIPLNTLYQNISMIRRGLREVGENDKALITTVPRQGFCINKKTTIRTVATTEHDAETEPYDIKIPSGIPFPPAAQPIVVEPEIKNLPFYRVRKTQIIFLLIASLFAGCSAGLLYAEYKRTATFFSDYVYLGADNECHFYTNAGGRSALNEGLPSMRNKLEGMGVSCKKWPWIYVTRIEHLPVTSVFLCKNELSALKESHCVSLLFRHV